ncbi:hypothetical protein GALMADRAFT_238906 [Galerina marginata CBS 339.88]|uniref:Mitochondrial K+-H+ exchange-related-domain-containing protein n=1 Tax=Galerina marginata (strain CBS 339.88) TaxID=685588 RepID=A0A067TT54_GALM3|nr:hypothetical protein GALMADRAFT_238906 [Galerina marginata CBS 339.88]
MRIIAIPLTWPSTRVLQTGSANLHRLTYYQFQISPERPKKPPSSSAASTGEFGRGIGSVEQEKKRKQWLPEEGLVNSATQKAADIWAGFGEAKGGWKLKTYQFGGKLMDRVDFEELALKSIVPSLGFSITHLKGTPALDAPEKTQSTTISLIYPPSLLSGSTALADLRAHVKHRIPLHRMGFYSWAALTPFTFPLKIIPIIPNLPFFFCAWRLWSHYRAYQAAEYLESLLNHDLIVPQPSEALDQVYKTYQLSPHADPHHTLLTRDAMPSILSIFQLGSDSTAAADLYRAVEQARVRVATGRS